MLPVAAAALLALLAAGAGWWFWPTTPAGAGKPSIAVLPFDNLGGDEATGRLADGITEDIITDLARFRGLDVIARNSTAVYKGKPVDMRQVGKELGVGYVLEGSIQRQADHVRVTAQLIDADNRRPCLVGAMGPPGRGRVRGPDRDRRAGGEHARRVRRCCSMQSRAAAKRKRPADLEAYDLSTLQYEAFLRGTEADLEQALTYGDAAIAKDPGLVRAYTKKAWILINLAKYREQLERNLGRGGAALLDRRSRSILTTQRPMWSWPRRLRRSGAGPRQERPPSGQWNSTRARPTSSTWPLPT